MEAKTFPTVMVASAMTGVALCSMKMSDVHEITTQLAGHDVWTHELGNLQFMGKVQAAAYERFPNMPTKAEAQADYAAAAAKAVLAYGEALHVEPGTMQRGETPLETLPEHLREKTIAVVI